MKTLLPILLIVLSLAACNDNGNQINAASKDAPNADTENIKVEDPVTRTPNVVEDTDIELGPDEFFVTNATSEERVTLGSQTDGRVFYRFLDSPPYRYRVEMLLPERAYGITLRIPFETTSGTYDVVMNGEDVVTIGTIDLVTSRDDGSVSLSNQDVHQETVSGTVTLTEISEHITGSFQLTFDVGREDEPTRYMVTGAFNDVPMVNYELVQAVYDAQAIEQARQEQVSVTISGDHPFIDQPDINYLRAMSPHNHLWLRYSNDLGISIPFPLDAEVGTYDLTAICENPDSPSGWICPTVNGYTVTGGTLTLDSYPDPLNMQVLFTAEDETGSSHEFDITVTDLLIHP